MPPGLSLLDEEPAERGDAARNRRLLLQAAAELVARVGVDALTMDELARHAGVGKGTVFRRFGSRSGLMNALLDHAERELQAGYLTGPPPLGPGAPPVERLVAFGQARLALIPVQGELQRAASGEFRYANPAYLASANHVMVLLREAGVDGDLRVLADMLLAALDAQLVLHQLHQLGATVEQIGECWARLARGTAVRRS